DLQRSADAVVEAEDDAEQLCRLTMAARQEQDARARLEKRLGQAEQGDDGGLAGLTTAVSNRRGWAASRTVTCQRSGSSPRLRMSRTARGRWSEVSCDMEAT